MSMPVYFAQPPQSGWYCAADGGLLSPECSEPQELLIFDDRNPLPQDIGPLCDALRKMAKDTVVLDFERTPSDAACQLVRELSAHISVAAPLCFCGGTKAVPILCYDPVQETFAAFQKRFSSACWLELRPVAQTVHFPVQLSEPSQATADFFSQVLQCHYRMEENAEGFFLHLYDTPESFRARFASIEAAAAIGLCHELEAMAFRL